MRAVLNKLFIIRKKLTIMKQFLIFVLILFFSVFVLSNEVEAEVTNRSEIRGVVIHEAIYSFPHNWTIIAQTLANYGIDSVYVNDFDVFNRRPDSEITAAINAFHAYGIEYHAVMNGIAESKNEATAAIDYQGNKPDLYAQCPIKVKQYVEAAIRNYLGNHSDVDGIMIDYMRTGINYCYCDEHRAAFDQWYYENYSEHVSNWTEFYPDQSKWNIYASWRNEPVNELVRIIHDTAKSIKPNITISAAVWTYFSDCPIYWRKFLGQDVGRWIKEGWLDFVAPMMYTDAIYGERGETLESFINANLKYMTGGVEGKIPLIALTGLCTKNATNFATHIAYIRSRGLDGWIFWRYGGPGVDSGGQLEDITPYIEAITKPNIFELGNVQVFVNETEATISWTTTLPTTSKVEYNNSPLFTATWETWGGFPYWRINHIQGNIAEDNKNVTIHTLKLTNLQPGTTYYFRVQSQGDSGIVTSKVYNFTTVFYPTNITGKLIDKNNKPVDAKIIVYQQGTSNVISSTQTNSTGHYTLSLPKGVYDIQFNLTNFPISSYSIKLLAVNLTEDIRDLIKYVSYEDSKVSIALDNNYSKRIEVYSMKKPLRVKLNGTIIPSWSYNENNKLLSINLSVVIAKSGYWKDIQEAVNLVASMGGGNVYIPEGTFNFVNVNESWTGARVIIPAGVNLFGAPTEKYSNGSVKEWKTVLVMPWDVPGFSGNVPVWFKIVGSKNPDKPSRFSDLKLVGYRDFDPNSTSLHQAMVVENVVNFRIDHCYFRHTCEGVYIVNSSGVIDHCLFINEYGWHGGSDWGNRTIGYGVNIARTPLETRWENITNILGKYLDYTVFIEDCVFTKWRHCVVGNLGAHYVVRHCIFKGDFAFASIDLHPMWIQPYSACRAAEIYENVFKEQIETGIAIKFWSGGGVVFNNIIRNHTYFITSDNGGWNPNFYPHDIYIWNNDINGTILHAGAMTEGEDYFLYKPDWYTPYPYPHPLTLE